MRRSGLGRGLSALLPDAATAEEPEGGVVQLALDAIEPNPFQPRRAFADDKLAELAASLREHGVVQPLLVRPGPDGRYQLVAGERRWRAARLAELATVPCVVRRCTERELLEIALVENLQREDINPLEAAEAYQRCLDEFGLTQEELAARVGKSRPAVANTLRLLRLAAEVREAIAAGRLSEGHGRALLALADEDRQIALARRIEREQLSVREAERLARELQALRRKPRAVEPAGKAPHGPDPDLLAFQERLQRALGTRVEIRPAASGGTITVWYYENEDLERIAEALKP